MVRRLTPRRAACAIAALAALAAAPAYAASPIPEGPDASSSPAFIGHPATQRPVTAPAVPRNPFMAPNGDSELHVDAWQTDTNVGPGPLGRDMQRLSTFQVADCASVTFDSHGRIVAICVGLSGPTLDMFDAKTLDTLAQMSLPPRQPSASNPLTDFGAGGYFYLDNQDRAVIPTTTRHILVVGETPGPGFATQHDYDVTGAVPSGDEILSALPDWSGRIWFASKNGVVGDVNPATGAVHSLDTHEPIGNSFAVDETGGVYVVTDSALYRFDAGADGAPHVTWRATYANDGTSKPGQTEVGSGTTPTVMSGGYVSITDNADPIDVVVFRKAKSVRGSRLVCTVPVFSKGASDTDQSLVAAGDAMIAENNYGYASPAATEEGRTTTGGLERVDVDANGRGCHKVWHSNEIAPSVVPKASLANGLVYTYTHPGGDSSDPWYFTALDFRTGATVYKFRAGAGLGFNNNYAPVTLGPDGSAYIGTLGGLVLVRDATPPPNPLAARPHPRKPRPKPRPHRRARPRVGLRVTDMARGACRGRLIRVTLTGRDVRRVARMDVRLRGRLVARDRRRPFTRRVRVPTRFRTSRLAVTAFLRGGGRVTLRRTLHPCRTRARFED